jgi:FMN-dependent NADH-azoreductase
MVHILHVASSPTLINGNSRGAAERVIAGLDHTQLTIRDLDEAHLPQLTAEWNMARIVPALERTAHEDAILAQSDTLIAEIKAADTVIVSFPMYNFGVPASLKLWIDLICRPKVTFSYTSGQGVRGHMTGKKAIIVAAAGGVPIDGPDDYATPHLRQVLNFIGITDVTTLLAADINAPDA